MSASMPDAPSEPSSATTSTAITMVFGFERTNIHAVAEGVARVLNIAFEQRESSYTGNYYRYPAFRQESVPGYMAHIQRNYVKWEQHWDEPAYKAFRVILKFQDVESHQVELIEAAIYTLRKNPKTNGVLLYVQEQDEFVRDAIRQARARNKLAAKTKGQPESD